MYKFFFFFVTSIFQVGVCRIEGAWWDVKADKDGIERQDDEIFFYTMT